MKFNTKTNLFTWLALPFGVIFVPIIFMYHIVSVAWLGSWGFVEDWMKR